MTREIRFRGKHIDSGEWLIGDLVQDHFGDGSTKTYHIYPKDAWNSPDCYEVDPSTVGQYTGLKDKNRNEIFEGDIINWLMHRTDRTGYIAEGYVEFRTNEHAFVVINMFTTRDGRENVRNLSHCRKDLKVVGNIHDNPELLEGGGR